MPPQVVGEFLRRRVAARPVLFERLEADRLELGMDPRVELARGDRLVAHDLRIDLDRVLARVGRAPGEDLVEDAARA